MSKKRLVPDANGYQYVSTADPEIPETEVQPFVHQPFDQQPIQVVMQPEGQRVVIQQPENPSFQPPNSEGIEKEPLQLQQVIIVDSPQPVGLQLQQPLSPAHPQDDNPRFIYIFAFIALIIPLVGLIGMCVFNCGNRLGRRQKGAFSMLILATLIGMIVNGFFISHPWRT